MDNRWQIIIKIILGECKTLIFILQEYILRLSNYYSEVL